MTTAPLDTLDDAELLRQYVQTHSEEAFTALVRRYVDLIYSAALRRVRDPHLAEDVTQAVFLILARRARNLPKETILAAWFYKSARYAAANALRMQQRRAIHEQAAAALPRKEPRMDANWPQIEPVLEAAMDSLRGSDRQLILLRFFQNRSVGDISAMLGISDNTAAKRLSRAVDRLRTALTRRGVAASGSSVAILLSEQAVRAAPATAANISINTIAANASNNIAIEIARQVMRLMSLRKAALITLTTVIAVTLPITIVLFVHAQSAAPPPNAPAAPPPSTQPALPDRKLPEVRLDHVAMSDVMDFLKDVSGMRFNTDWNSLAQVGVFPSSPISLRAKDITLKQILDLIFAQFPNAAGRIKIDIGGDGVVNISAKAD
jgi:RNA polymerase sigma factor (sigma-70 family)